MRLRVMVVEDDPLQRKLFATWLGLAGFEAIMVGDERLAQTVAVEERPDVVMVDIRLPRISGLDVIENLKRAPENRDMPVMAITVLSSRQDEAACMAAGADQFMTKPSNMQRLADALLALAVKLPGARATQAPERLMVPPRVC